MLEDRLERRPGRCDADQILPGLEGHVRRIGIVGAGRGRNSGEGGFSAGAVPGCGSSASFGNRRSWNGF